MTTTMSCNVWDLTVDELLQPLSFLSSSSSTTTTTAITPIQQCCFLCGCVILLVLTVSEITQNYSQVDKLWSIVPAVYAWILVVGDDDRTFVMAVLLTLWGGRLTFNFSRRGGYTWPPWLGDEDYRYVMMMMMVVVVVGCTILLLLTMFSGVSTVEQNSSISTIHPLFSSLLPLTVGSTSKKDICYQSSRIPLRGNSSILGL
jgi:Protein of unknown function (DUF1295)